VEKEFGGEGGEEFGEECGCWISKPGLGFSKPFALEVEFGEVPCSVVGLVFGLGRGLRRGKDAFVLFPFEAPADCDFVPFVVCHYYGRGVLWRWKVGRRVNCVLSSTSVAIYLIANFMDEKLSIHDWVTFVE